MGMTIDEVLKIIKDGRIMPYIIKGNNEDDTEFNKTNIEALHVIVNIMHKYQKIQNIVDHYRENVRDKVTNENMEKILEVVEDGNDA